MAYQISSVSAIQPEVAGSKMSAEQFKQAFTDWINKEYPVAALKQYKEDTGDSTELVFFDCEPDVAYDVNLYDKQYVDEDSDAGFTVVVHGVKIHDDTLPRYENGDIDWSIASLETDFEKEVAIFDIPPIEYLEAWEKAQVGGHAYTVRYKPNLSYKARQTIADQFTPSMSDDEGYALFCMTGILDTCEKDPEFFDDNDLMVLKKITEDYIEI